MVSTMTMSTIRTTIETKNSKIIFEKKKKLDKSNLLFPSFFVFVCVCVCFIYSFIHLFILSHRGRGRTDTRERGRDGRERRGKGLGWVGLKFNLSQAIF